MKPTKNPKFGFLVGYFNVPYMDLDKGLIFIVTGSSFI